MKPPTVTEDRLPPGLVRCERCGEFNGTTKRKFLRPEAPRPWLKRHDRISVTCLCGGIVCPRCKKNMIHRPVSNSYEEKTNEIGHWPWFSGMMPCKECRQREEFLNR